MRSLILIALMFCASLAMAQKKVQYKASNGVTYYVEDTVRMARGTQPNGSFVYLVRGAVLEGVPKQFTNAKLIIKKIKEDKLRGVKRTYFVVDHGFKLMIEAAIEACEVTPCKSEQNVAANDKFDQLKKLKALFDSGALTQTEYNEQKQKLLNQR